MDKEEIKKKASEVTTLSDFVQLLNEIKFTVEGTNEFPITLENIFYYSMKEIPLEKKYKRFVVPKKSGGGRTIYSPVDPLKYIQSYINELLQNLYSPNDYVTGFVRGRSIVDNAIPHIGHKYILSLDLRNFFSNISEYQVRERLRKPPFEFNKHIAKIIANLCCVDLIRQKKTWKVLAQGAPTSPVLANAVCDDMDEELFKLSHAKNVTYTRYADDITLSANEEFWLKTNSNHFFHELYKLIPYKINFRKTRLQRVGNRQEITGLVISDKINVKRKYIKEIRNILYIWERYGYDVANENFCRYYLKNKSYVPSDYTINMINIIDGKLQFVKMIKGQQDVTYLKLFEKFKYLKTNFVQTSTMPIGIENTNALSKIQESNNQSNIV